MPVSAATRTRNFAVAATTATLLLAGCGTADDDASSIVRTTTNIAGASVVGVERDTSQACALPLPADSSNGATRTVTQASGSTEVPADPQRIVVLSTAALDATCALGLWERVVGTVTLEGPAAQPSYLGTGVLEIPGVGWAGQPDPALIEELDPDLIIGDAPVGDVAALDAIAPTVFTGETNDWQAEFTALARALGRGGAAATVLENYRTEANDVGVAIDSSATQASVVHFTDDSTWILGGNSFAGQVLGQAGVQRPGDQRGDSFQMNDIAEAEGDLIYVMFDGEAGEEYGRDVMDGSEWKDLSAVTDKRTFAVDETVWAGNGVTAARALLTDLSDSLNGYVTD